MEAISDADRQLYAELRKVIEAAAMQLVTMVAVDTKGIRACDRAVKAWVKSGVLRDTVLSYVGQEVTRLQQRAEAAKHAPLFR